MPISGIQVHIWAYYLRNRGVDVQFVSEMAVLVWIPCGMVRREFDLLDRKRV